MIYVGVSARNNVSTVGLVLWKVRKVFEEFPREYQLLVVDDASIDGTVETLEPYVRALPMTLISRAEPHGHAASIMALVNKALELTDRPKRDCLITLPPDFSVSPAVLPDLIKRTESGADVVVGEVNNGRLSAAHRFVRRSAPWLMKPGVRLAGFRDILSGVCAFRLVTLRACIREGGESLLLTEGSCSDVELLARAAALARQIAVVPTEPTTPPPGTKRRTEGALALALNLVRGSRRLEVPAPNAPVQRT